jgi:hypothetical protein
VFRHDQVTLFGLLFTPAFYVICRWFAGLTEQQAAPAPSAHRRSEC